MRTKVLFTGSVRGLSGPHELRCIGRNRFEPIANSNKNTASNDRPRIKRRKKRRKRCVKQAG